MTDAERIAELEAKLADVEAALPDPCRAAGIEPLDAQVRRLRHRAEAAETPRARVDCINCGVGARADEDNCCVTCGRDCVIVPAGVPDYSGVLAGQEALESERDEGQTKLAEAEAREKAKAKVLERVLPFLDFAAADYEDGASEHSASALAREVRAALAAGKPEMARDASCGYAIRCDLPPGHVGAHAISAPTPPFPAAQPDSATSPSSDHRRGA